MKSTSAITIEDLGDLVPIVVRPYAKEEALLIVTETNLIQRSFADLKHSERAVALTAHYETMKIRLRLFNSPAPQSLRGCFQLLIPS